MRMVDLIAKKRDGGELTPQEINFIIERYTDGTIPDYQMSAFAMAVFFRGMTKPETAELTDAMARSGEMISLDSIPGVKVDKHSTGGVGDTTTLILAPLAAAAGIPVAKMSGRGLGHTGGTLDKLESIPGFNVELTSEQFIRQVNSCGVAVIGQTGNLTPADKMLYGLRDVTATVDSIPMIAASIMSKKIAAGADAIVLDVKTGSGAFMKSVEEAEELAHTMVDIGKALNRRTTAVISDMSQPLGFAIGNSLEVAEAIQTLQGEGPDDLTKLSLTLGANMLVLGGKTQDFEEAYALLEQLIRSGAALDKFKQLIAAQGGDPSVVDQPERLPRAKQAMEVTASKSGYVHAIQAEEIGIATMMLGAGRETKDAIIDLAVGIELRKKIGQHVRQGETIAVIHANSQETEEIERKIINAYSIQPQPCESPQLIHRVIPSL